MSVRITLGNLAPIEVHHHDPEDPQDAARVAARGGEVVARGADADGRPLLQHVISLDPTVSHTTEFLPPEGWSVLETVHSLAGLNEDSSSHAWAYHSKAAPGWVLVEDENDPARAALVQALLEERFGIRKPPAGEITALLTNAGYDYFAKQGGGAASNSAIAVNMALTANVTAPAAGDTTLTGEITTAGGGLVRAAAAYAHTAAASTYTLTKTFTANGTDALPVTIGKMGLFDASPSGGNMPFETLISPTVTLSASGDAITVTETVTL
jgi:hypothetical protein